MARGKKCPACGHPMYAEREERDVAGTTVWYRCRNSKCGQTEKVFEGK